MNKKEGIKLCESELKVMELLWEEGELRAGEIVRRRLAAQIAIDALAVHVELAGHIFHIFVFAVSHGK